MRGTFLVCAAAAMVMGLSGGRAVSAQETAPLRTIKGGILDEIRLFAEKMPAMTVVRMRPFSATDTDISKGEKKDETKTMQADAPRILGERFVARLKQLGPFTDVAMLDTEAAPAGAVIVEGKFTELDPGSRAKRYFVGFGAGKSGVTVEGTVKSGDGMVLATFEQRRIGVMGAAGGDSLGKLRADAQNIGEDLASFLNAWSQGKKLK